jgi:hypothetical protein
MFFDTSSSGSSCAAARGVLSVSVPFDFDAFLPSMMPKTMTPKKRLSRWDQQVRISHMIFWVILAVALVMGILAYFTMG